MIRRLHALYDLLEKVLADVQRGPCGNLSQQLQAAELVKVDQWAGIADNNHRTVSLHR